MFMLTLQYVNHEWYINLTYCYNNMFMLFIVIHILLELVLIMQYKLIKIKWHYNIQVPLVDYIIKIQSYRIAINIAL